MRSVSRKALICNQVSQSGFAVGLPTHFLSLPVDAFQAGPGRDQAVVAFCSVSPGISVEELWRKRFFMRDLTLSPKQIDPSIQRATRKTPARTCTEYVQVARLRHAPSLRLKQRTTARGLAVLVRLGGR